MAGDIWLADVGDEVRRPVFVVSDVQFNRHSQRAIVAPLMSQSPPGAWPWYVACPVGVIAVDHVTSIDIDRLVERRERVNFETLRQVRRVVMAITN